MVIAAGSVMNEPNKGAIVSIETHHAAGLWPPKPAARPSSCSANFTTGLVEAMAIITTTNIGSIYIRS